MGMSMLSGAIRSRGDALQLWQAHPVRGYELAGLRVWDDSHADMGVDGRELRGGFWNAHFALRGSWVDSLR